MTALLNQFPFTVEAYRKLVEVGIIKDTDRVELINGQIVTMSPIKSEHASMVDDLLELLISHLAGKAIIKGQNPIHLDNHSEPEPDVVIARLSKDRYRSNHPEPKDIHVVIEVSDTTLKKDQEIKVPLYASANIPEYWIINLVDKQIEVYRSPKNGEYHFKQIISEGSDLTLELLDFSISYGHVFR